MSRGHVRRALQGGGVGASVQPLRSHPCPWVVISSVHSGHVLVCQPGLPWKVTGFLSIITEGRCYGNLPTHFNICQWLGSGLFMPSGWLGIGSGGGFQGNVGVCSGPAPCVRLPLFLAPSWAWQTWVVAQAVAWLRSRHKELSPKSVLQLEWRIPFPG